MAHRPLHAADGFGPPTGILGRSILAPGLGSRLAAALLAERERWFLWLPVGVGAGIALYFAMPAEPPVWLGLIYIVPLIPAFLYLRSSGSLENPVSVPLVIAFAPIALGMAIAPMRTWLVDAPVLERRAAYVVEARVRLVEDRVRGERLLLDQPALEGVSPDDTPVLIRVSLRSALEGLQPGDRVRLRAMLMPPSPPSQPHGFDFARQAYFMGLGAVGYALGHAERIAPAQDRTWSLGIAHLRQVVADRIRSAVPGDAGAVGVALLTGLRGAIPEHVWREMQIAGIAHLLAISGLHLGLVAGTLFFAVRIAGARGPPLARRLPTKKVAAGIARFGAGV
jgi:competence protein ComEC